MRLIGTIAFAQVQQSPLKQGEGANRTYNPSPVLRVPGLRLTCQGVFGVRRDGTEIIDVHHVDHPQSRNRGNANGISLNFLPNYDRIRARFPYREPDQIDDGIGGENLVIDPVPDFQMDWLNTELIIERASDGHHIRLEDVMVTSPCTPFSNYVAGRTIGGGELRDTLQFLSDGTRGFYASMALEQPSVIVSKGDRLFAVE